MEGLEGLEETKKRNVVFIGGGPATMAFLCFLEQESKHEQFFKHFNLIILEKSLSFGAGTLGEYGIDCNIPTFLFTTGLYPKGKNLNQKHYNKETTITSNILESSVYWYLKNQKGMTSFPLITSYLESLGNYLLAQIYEKFKIKVFFPLIQVDHIIYNQAKLFDIYYTSLKDGSKNLIKADYLVLATGGVQKPPTENVLQYLEATRKMENFYYSDYIYRLEGYTNIKAKLESMGKARILIVGASNSAFSAAGILLYGVTEEKNYKENCKYVYATNPDCANCESDNCCFGKINENKWKGVKKIVCDMEITVLYRDFIKVCYDNPEEAKQNNYYDFDNTSLDNYNKLYTLVGLRGDCKELYLKAKSGVEKRIKIEKAKNFEEQKPYFDSHDIIIWACGYQTKRLDLKDHTGQPIEFDCDEGLAHIDKFHRPLIQGAGIIKNLYGIGKGFPDYAYEHINGKPGRGDVIKRYYSKTPKMIIQSLFENIKK